MPKKTKLESYANSEELESLYREARDKVKARHEVAEERLRELER